MAEFECKFSSSEVPCEMAESEVTICEICRSPICAHHISEVDRSVCVGCFNDSALAAKESPLVDEDGVVHKPGRVIQPLGFTYKTLMQRLVDYTEDELILHIHHVKAQIEEAQRIIDYRRLDKSASLIELEERQGAKRRKLRFQGVSTLASGSKSIAGPDQLPSAKEKQLRTLAARLRTIASMLGIPCKTPEDLAKVAQAVKAIGEAKARAIRVEGQKTVSNLEDEVINE